MKIPTPSGWTTIGNLSIGDEIFDERGGVCRVVALHPIDPTPVSYELTFDDGVKIVACADHQWLTFDAKELGELTRLDPDWRARRQSRRQSRALSDSKKPGVQRAVALRNSLREYVYKLAPTGSVRTTQQIADTLHARNGSRANHAIPLTKPLVLPDIDLRIDPYVLGAWLGDGNSRHASITCHDPEILDHIAAAGFTVSARGQPGAYGINHGLIGLLRELGLLANKHIPSVYLRASLNQRLALIQGLMDTDGNATGRGACEFTTTLPALRDGFRELLATVGIKAEGSEGRAMLNGRDCGPKYRFKFVTSLPAFRLKRKLDRQNRVPRRTTQFRYIKACRRIDPTPMRCITVDSASHLYLAGPSMVPTHNSDLLLGMAATRHRSSIIFRREFKQLQGLRERAETLYGPHGTFNGQKEIWRLKIEGDVRRRVEFGACQLIGDEQGYQGRPHDLKCFDEVTHFTEGQFRFLIGWNRSDIPGQRSRVIATGNPPTNAEGYWVISYWGPWLDPKHPNPAKEGELRWFAQTKDKKTGKFVDTEVAGPGEIIVEGEPYPIKPLSRTFIRAFLTDNPVYMASGYMAVLQGMPEPLRSQMLHGDFLVGHEDHPRQVIPTEWVMLAQRRWRPKEEYLDPRQRLDALGVDVARGGKANTVITPRWGTWFGEQVTYPGSETPDGFAVLQNIVQNIPVTERPNINIDVIGVGASVYDLAKGSGLAAFAMDARHTSYARDASGSLGFTRKKSEWWWKFREALDPLMGDDLAIPPDRQLLADLTAPRFEMKTNGIQVEDKEDLISRIGRSPDHGDSLVLAHAQSVSPIATHLL